MPGRFNHRMPIVTLSRAGKLLPALEKLKKRGARIVVNTKTPSEHDEFMLAGALEGLGQLQRLGVHVIYTDQHHRKFTIIDRKVMYEGSLNILSQNRSR